MTARSTTLRSSRTLPGQAYAQRRAAGRARRRDAARRACPRAKCAPGGACPRAGRAAAAARTRRRRAGSRGPRGNGPRRHRREVAVRRRDDAHVDRLASPRRRGRTRSCSSTRSSFACGGERQLADLVEEHACRRRRARRCPRVARSAPVNAPFSCPNSSLSMSSAGIARAVNTTNGRAAARGLRGGARARRAPCRCRSRPASSTGASVGRHALEHARRARASPRAADQPLEVVALGPRHPRRRLEEREALPRLSALDDPRRPRAAPRARAHRRRTCRWSSRDRRARSRRAARRRCAGAAATRARP